MKIYAHRGFSARYPENTILAFEKAIDESVHGIEIDIQKTLDDEIVLVHDENLKRLTGEDIFVKDLLLRDIKKLNILDTKEKIPTIDEYFDLIKNKDIISNIEIKTSIFRYNGIEELLVKKIEEYKLEEKIIISSFYHKSLSIIKELKDIPVGALVMSGLYMPEEYLKSRGYEYYHPLYYSFDLDQIENLKKYNIKINLWTVDDIEMFNKLKDSKIDGIITNCPDKYKNII